MNKSMLAMMLMLLLVGTALAGDETATGPSAPYYASIEEARAAVGDDRNIMVDFYTDW